MSRFVEHRPRRTRIAGEEQVIAELRRCTPRRGMRKAVAQALDVSENTLSRVLAGKAPPSLKIAGGLGFRLVKDHE